MPSLPVKCAHKTGDTIFENALEFRKARSELVLAKTKNAWSPIQATTRFRFKVEDYEPEAFLGPGVVLAV